MFALVAAVFHRIAKWTVFIFYVLAFSLRATGRANVPKRGPVLLISNHQSFLDPPGIGIETPRLLSYLARKTLFDNPVLGLILRLLDSVPIDQDGVGKDGIKNILKHLEAGRAVLVFPEGERTPDGNMHDLKPGISLLLKRVRCPIVPVGVAGMYAAWPRHQKLPCPSPLFLAPTPRTLAVAFGKPRDPATLDGLSRDEMLAVLRDDIAEMIKEAEAIRRK